MMGGTRIFVLKLKDLVRIGIFVLLGLALVILLLVLLVPRGRGASSEPEAGYPYPSGRFIPGTYVSTIVLNDGPVQVRVTVSENEILMVYMTGMDEVQRTFFPLFEPRMRDLAEEVLRAQSAYIQPQTDYPVTTGILQDAVIAALRLAYTACCCNTPPTINAEACCCDEIVEVGYLCCCDEVAEAEYELCCCDEVVETYYEDCCCSGLGD